MTPITLLSPDTKITTDHKNHFKIIVKHIQSLYIESYDMRTRGLVVRKKTEGLRLKPEDIL